MKSWKIRLRSEHLAIAVLLAVMSLFTGCRQEDDNVVYQ